MAPHRRCGQLRVPALRAHSCPRLPSVCEAGYSIPKFTRQFNEDLIVRPLSIRTLLLTVGTNTLLLGTALADQSLEMKVDEYLKPYIDAGGFSGAILIARDGKILLSRGYGMANYELEVQNTSQTRFHIASISKTFTAAAILMLEEQGKLSTRDSLVKFVPDYPSGEEITIRHLLTHTSGIPNANDLPDYDEKSKSPHNLEEIIGWFKNRPLDFNPGAKYSYSNSNYNLLAYILEKVSGRNYGDFLSENVFTPLRMQDTGHDGDAGTILRNQASGYVPKGTTGIANAPCRDWTNLTGNGSLYSTVEDLYKWDQALRTERILNRNSLNEMFSEQVKGVGYGWFVRQNLNRPVADSNGRTPGFTSYIERFLDADACIIILSNNYAPVPHLIVKDLAAMLFGEPYTPPGSMKAVRLEAPVLDRLVGQYQFGSEFYRPGVAVSVEREGNNLVLKWSTAYKNVLISISETTFLLRDFWARIIFQKDSAGEATGFLWRDTTEYPARKR